MREKIKLESTAGTGHFYTTTKNKRSTPDKIEMKKYDPRARKHVIYKETKSALALVDIEVLDHFIVAGSRTMSFAERGLL